MRAAFKKALAAEGIPGHIDEMARRFYGARGHSAPAKSQPTASPKVDSSGWESPAEASDSGGIVGLLRRLFGGG